jgi:hypothetical protein
LNEQQDMNCSILSPTRARGREGGGNPDAWIESSDQTVIKTLLGKLYGVPVVVAAIPLLDPAAKPGAVG